MTCRKSASRQPPAASLPVLGLLLIALALTVPVFTAAGCQSMTTVKALHEEREKTAKLENDNKAILAERAEDIRRAQEAKQKAERLEQRENAAVLVSTGDPAKALEVIEAIYHPPPVPGKDAAGNDVTVMVKEPVLEDAERAQLEVLRGTALFNLQKKDEALTAFQNSVKADPGLRLARRNLGKLHFIDKRYQEALEAWKEELADGYRDADLLYLVAQARYEIGVSKNDLAEKEAARLAMQSVLVERPRDLEVHRWLANLEYESGRYAEAARLLEAIRREAPLDPEYLEMLGKCHYQLRDPHRALDLLRLSAQIRAPGPEGMKLLGELYAAEGLKGRAGEWLARVRQGDPKEAPPEERFKVGMLFLEGGRSAEALEWLGAVAERDPQYAESQAALARLNRDLGKPDAALAAFEIARKARPQDGQLHLAAAAIYLERKNLKQSLEAYSRAAALPETEADGLAGMAEVFHASQNPEAALEHYRKALAAKPGEARFLNAVKQIGEELRLRAEDDSLATAEKASER